jgi:hypothetical protein
VLPAGESVLIDTGNPGGRDTDRILAVVSAAGLTQLDYVVLTHYHGDHVGGLQELAKRIPIRHFIDHGPSVEDREQVTGFQTAYPALFATAKHTVVAPGDKLALVGVDWRIVSSAGKVIRTALPGGGQRNATSASPNSQRRPGRSPSRIRAMVSRAHIRRPKEGDLLPRLASVSSCRQIAFSEHLRLEHQQSRPMLPGIAGQSCLQARVLEECQAIPLVLDGDLRQQQSASISLFDDQPVAPDLDLLG